MGKCQVPLSSKTLAARLGSERCPCSARTAGRERTQTPENTLDPKRVISRSGPQSYSLSILTVYMARSHLSSSVCQ